MIISELTRDFDKNTGAHWVYLRCDFCQKRTGKVWEESCKEPDEWTRMRILSEGWTQRLVGRVQKDCCAQCSKKAQP